MQYFKIGISIFVRHKKRIRFQMLNGYRKHELTAEKPFNFNKGESFYDKSIYQSKTISLSGRRVFDSQSIRLSETVFFHKNPRPVPTHVSSYDVLLNFRSAEMAGNLIITQNSDPVICDWLTQWLFTRITSSSSR